MYKKLTDLDTIGKIFVVPVENLNNVMRNQAFPEPGAPLDERAGRQPAHGQGSGARSGLRIPL